VTTHTAASHAQEEGGHETRQAGKCTILFKRKTDLYDQTTSRNAGDDRTYIVLTVIALCKATDDDNGMAGTRYVFLTDREGGSVKQFRMEYDRIRVGGRAEG
jgi:hypothetical protein